jgi:5'-3' exonuclease
MSKTVSCVIIVDTSYLVYHRYNATLTWYKFKCPEVDCPSLHTNNEFVEAFKKHLAADLTKLKKRWGSKQLVFCKDARRATLWRTTLFPEYKGTRKSAATFNPEFFDIVYAFLDKEGYDTAWGDQLEADDVAYLYAKHISKSVGEDTPIVFVTGDCDYLQCRSDKWGVFTLKGDDMGKKSCGEPKKDLLKKIITGDKSDNIPPICRPMGPKLVDSLLAMSPVDFESWLAEKGDVVVERYKLNKTLIDWSCIPTEHCAINCCEKGVVKVVNCCV